jgi:hypothetical protein
MRAVRRTGIVLLILFVLLAIADRVGVGLAEDEAASRINGRYGMEGDPKVEIEGIPFLTQLVGGELDKVKFSAPRARVTAGGERISFTKLKVTAEGIEPKNSFSSFHIDRATGSAMISYADFNKVLGREGTTVKYGGKPGRLRFSTQVKMLGRTIHQSGTATVRVRNGDTLSPDDLDLDRSKIPGLSQLVAGSMDMTRKFSELPVGMKVKSVEPAREGVHISLTGQGLNL